MIARTSHVEKLQPAAVNVDLRAGLQGYLS
jgi:hypothetical protein